MNNLLKQSSKIHFVDFNLEGIDELVIGIPFKDIGSEFDAVAAGITGIYFNVDSLCTLNVCSDIRAQSKKSVIFLIQSIKKQ